MTRYLLSILLSLIWVASYAQPGAYHWDNPFVSSLSVESLELKVLQEPQNPENWWQYYIKKREILGSNELKSFSENDQVILSEIIKKAENSCPNSQQVQLIKAFHSPFSEEFLSLTENNNHPASRILNVNYHLSKGNQAEVNRLIHKLKSEEIFDPSVISYHRDLIQLLPDDGVVIITQGFFDTYPLLFLQNENRNNKKIEVIPLDLLASESFRERTAALLGLRPNQLKGERSKVLNRMMKSDKKIVHASLLIPSVLLDKIPGAEFTGLSYSLSRSSIDKLWSETLRIATQTNFDLNGEFAQNYLPLFIGYYHHLSNQDRSADAQRIKSLIFEIAKLKNVEHLIQSSLERE